MRLALVGGFLTAILPLIATPGTSLALLTQRVGSGGPRQAAPVILGTVTGLYVHATLAAAGLSVLVMRSSELFTAVRIAGAVYLMALGVWTWRSVRGANPASAARQPARPPGAGRSAYRQALLGNVLNVKAASIFLTLVPQFVDPQRPVALQILILATAQVGLVTGWLLLCTLLIRRAARVLRSPTAKAALGRITGTVLVFLGLRTAMG